MRRWYEESLPDSFAELLAAVADNQGVRLPDMVALLQAVWEPTGDHPVDPAAADAVRPLKAAGLTCLLASNTCRPRAHRERTLAEAELNFMISVCSSDIGAAKPDTSFYDKVVELAAQHAATETGVIHHQAEHCPMLARTDCLDTVPPAKHLPNLPSYQLDTLLAHFGSHGPPTGTGPTPTLPRRKVDGFLDS